jgi:peroxiredoxin
MSLQSELDAFMADVRTKVPPEVLGPIDAFYAQGLHAPGLFPRVPKEGDALPDFELGDALGRSVRLSALLADGPVVLSFYRGAWCPFCNLELRALQAVLRQIRSAGATLVAVSPELPDQSLPLIEREGLAFPVLSDPGNRVASAYGLVFALEGEIRRISQEVFGVDLPAFNGDDSWTLPVPATFVIDPQRRARLVFFDPEFRHRVEPAQILQALTTLTGEATTPA